MFKPRLGNLGDSASKQNKSYKKAGYLDPYTGIGFIPMYPRKNKNQYTYLLIFFQNTCKKNKTEVDETYYP